MKQMARGALAVLTLVGLTACVDDPQERINNDDFKTLQAYPEVAWVRTGPDSTAVYFRLINDFGYGTPTHLTLSDVTGPITVTHDTLFRRYYTNGDPTDTNTVPYIDGHMQRFFVKKPVPGEGSFKVTASNGVSTVVRFRIEAADLGTISNANPVVGENVVINAPAFQKFLPDAQVVYVRGGRPARFPTLADTARGGATTPAGTIISREADGSSLTFRAAMDVTGTVRVTRTFPLHSGISPDFTPVTLATTDTMKSTRFGTRRLVDPVTDRPIDQTTGSLATDSIQAAGTLKVGGVDVTTVQPGQVLVVNLGGFQGSLGTVAGKVPFAFLKNTRIFVGGVEAGVVHTTPTIEGAAIGLDSNTVSILVPAHVSPPPLKTTIPVTLVNTALNFDPTFLFGTALASSTAIQPGFVASVVVGYLNSTGNNAPVTNYAGTNTRAAAPQLPKMGIFPTTPANTRTIMINDVGPFLMGGECATIGFPAGTTGCKLYKIGGNETGRPVDAEVRWDVTTAARVGVYSVAASGTAVTAIVPLPGLTAAATTGGSAVAAATMPSANSYYIAVITNGPVGALAWTSLRFTQR